MSAALLDGNVLVALTVVEHVHHDVAVDWFAADQGPFATTPITQGTLVRFLLRAGQPVGAVTATLAGVTGHARHELWPDDLPLTAVDLDAVLGHRQVTDAYLVGLARHRGGRVVTFDRGLAATHPDAVTLLGG